MRASCIRNGNEVIKRCILTSPDDVLKTTRSCADPSAPVQAQDPSVNRFTSMNVLSISPVSSCRCLSRGSNCGGHMHDLGARAAILARCRGRTCVGLFLVADESVVSPNVATIGNQDDCKQAQGKQRRTHGAAPTQQPVPFRKKKQKLRA